MSRKARRSTTLSIQLTSLTSNGLDPVVSYDLLIRVQHGVFSVILVDADDSDIVNSKMRNQLPF